MRVISQKIKKIPDKPGVYFFYGARRELLYVGKASSLKNRVRSYFAGTKGGRPIERILHEVKDVGWEVADSVLEAIILEANYIRRKKPRYNILGRDDKSWNYITISRDEYPVVATVRQHEIEHITPTGRSIVRAGGYASIFGPYPGLNTKEAMKLLRKLFYFSDCQKSKKKSRPCLYRQMGQCLGVCTGEITPAEYKHRVITPLTFFLRGNKKRLVKNLELEMKAAAKRQEFEEAARLRNQVRALTRIQDVALLNKSFFESEARHCDVDFGAARIEGYDISNLGASGKVGSMVVFTHGERDKKQYRKFRIKTVEGQSDVDCLAEVLSRRLAHNEWPLPDVYLIDGGKPQVNRARKILRDAGIEKPVVGIAKGPERKRNDFIVDTASAPSDKADDRLGFVKWAAGNRSLLIRVRDEAHRFAIAYQKKTRKLLP